MYISLQAMIFLCFCVFLAGFVDSAAGGGGLISIPAYFFVGLPAHTAIGCNKFSAACGTTFSAFRFFKHGALEWRIALVSALFSFISSTAISKNLLLIYFHPIFRNYALFNVFFLTF